MSAALQSAAPEELTTLRLRLLANGYRPVPISGPHMRVNSAGKRPLLDNWREVCASADEAAVRRWVVTDPDCTNTGILTGDTVGVDIDVPVPELAEQIDRLAEAMLGPTPLHRIGKAPKRLRCYRAEVPTPKAATPELLLPDGLKMQVEVLGAGQQFVAYGIHPDTQRPYAWPCKSPLDVPLADLPVVTEAAVRGFLAAAEAVLRQAGGRTKAGIKAAEKATQRGPQPVEQTTARPAGAAGSEFFREVNRRALAGLDRWIASIQPDAKQEAGTGAWRVSSADLGRSLDEDWSIHPIHGGRDFGEEKPFSPIDAVMEYGGAPNAQDAAFWLCERLGIAPAEAGWREPKKRPAQEANAADLDGFDLTEDGIAQGFTAKHQDVLRFDHHAGSWFHWNGQAWRKEETKLAFSWARGACRQLAREGDAKSRTKATLARATTAAAVERFAQADRAFAVTSEIWDRDPFLLGTPGGTVDLRTGELRPAMLTDYITKQTSVGPAAKADCPLWLSFLHDATKGDADLIRFLQQFCGYLLTGDTSEHALLFLHGTGGNGKTVFLNTVAGILGEYHRTAPMEMFMSSPNARHPTELARLTGARMVCASETEEEQAWAETRLKQLTGGDTIAARFMGRDFFEFRPQFKLVIVGNNKPLLRNVDNAARRRINMVPFVHTPVAPNSQLEAKLRTEWPAILRWMLDGCLSWYAFGLFRPKVVLAATDEYFREQDTVRRWIEDKCERGGKDVFDTADALFRSWSGYALANGEKPGTTRRFAQILTKHGGEPARHLPGNHDARGWLGIRVKPADAANAPAF